MHLFGPGFAIGYKMLLCAEDVARGRYRFFLCGGDDMGVGIRGEACVEGAEHFGHDLDVHSVPGCDGGESHKI